MAQLKLLHQEKTWEPIKPMVPEISINSINKKFKRNRVVKTLFLLFFCTCLYTQVFAYTLEGTVSDAASGKPVRHAQIEWISSGKVAYTDSRGFYRLTHIKRIDQPGELLISAEGFHQQTLNVSASQEAVLTVNIKLVPLQKDLAELLVSARLSPRSELSSRLAEKKAIPILDIASGDFIDRSASLSAADVVQHILGLSITHKHEGTSDKAIIRGMEAKYSYTLIDGLKIPSPDEESRSVSLDIFPSGMLDRVEVYKSLTADMEGDAIGGVVNLVMRKAPEKQVFNINLSTGYSSYFVNNSFRHFNSSVVQDKSPYERFGAEHEATSADFTKDNLYFQNRKPWPDLTADILYGKQFLNAKFGLLAGLTYKNLHTGSDGFFMPPDLQPGLNNQSQFTDFDRRSYSNDKINVSGTARFTYAPDSSNHFSLNYLYLNQKDIESRYTIDTNLYLGRSVVGTGRVYLEDRSRVHEQIVNNLSLRGEHRLNNLHIDWAGVYSVATGRYPDWAELNRNTGILPDTNGKLMQLPVLLATVTRSWISNKEKDLDLILHLNYKPAYFHDRLTIGAGGLFRDKSRDNFYNSYTFNPLINEAFTTIYNAQFLNNNAPQDPLGSVNNPNTYHATERISAAYLLAIYTAGRSEISAGLRMELTDQHVVSDLDPTVSFGKLISINYKDFLPDLSWKYSIASHQDFRLGYFKGITRPALNDITFAALAFEDYIVAGNPFLIRTSADNLDARYELFTLTGGEFKSGIFYKHIRNAFERTLLNGDDELYPIPSGNLSYTPAGQLTEQDKNTGSASNEGAELSYSQSFGNFNLSGNYTYTHSTITRTKKYLTREDPANSASNEITISRPEKGPLAGQSEHLANLNLFYRNNPLDASAQLSFVYTGRRIDLVSPWYGLDLWQRQNLRANLSITKNFGTRWKLNFGISNLFNTSASDDILQHNPAAGSDLLPGQTRADRIQVLKENYYKYYMLSVKYQF